MKKDFDYWKEKHDSKDLSIFNSSKEGQLWLKIKSITRGKLIQEFCPSMKITLTNNSLKGMQRELYSILINDLEKANKKLDKFILFKNKEIQNKLDSKKLVSELFKHRVYEWGGDYQNSLDKYLVSHYVKTINSYNVLLSKFEKEINSVVRGYVLNSWYNHWSSVLIEHIFKSHKIVLPSVGQIKNVDFFINNIPFDLKVTYFPSEYLRIKRKQKEFPLSFSFSEIS